jgi:hypothetical protein
MALHAPPDGRPHALVSIRVVTSQSGVGMHLPLDAVTMNVSFFSAVW